MKWRRIEPGEYRSSDGRFRIIRDSYVTPKERKWVLLDTDEPLNFPNRYYRCSSLHECKQHAEIVAVLRSCM